MHADQKYSVGDEVFISYGILTNPDLLNTYGFIMLDNPFETVGFKLNLGDVAPSQSMASAEIDYAHGVN